MEIPEIDVTDLAGLLPGAGPVLDVRMPDEYAEGHVPGAVLVPLPELPDRLAEVPSADPLYVVCRSGARSMAACEQLAAAGRQVVNVAGGTLAWIDAGQPVVTGDRPD